MPPLLLLPLDAVPGLRPTLDLLFAETDQVRCGSRLRAGQQQKLIAAELGFSNASALSRAFKQRYGKSPRAWMDAAPR